MKPIKLLLALIAPLALPPLPAQTITREGAMEKMMLVAATDAKTWVAVESSAEPVQERVKTGASSWRWRVDVDYNAGEAKYPIGWPRLAHTIPEGGLRDWSAWDFLHCWIYLETSRATLPHEPIALAVYAPDRANSFTRVLGEVQKDRWVEINIPVSQLGRPGDVRYLQFNVSESNYKHGDRLDFFLNDLALTRHAEPAVASLTPENTVLFSDAKRLAVRVDLLGVKSNQRAKLACELRRDGRTVARAAVDGVRGAQRLVVELGGAALAPGAYEIGATIDGRPQPQPAVANVRVVESPWKQP